MLRTGGVDDLTNHRDSHIPQLTAEVVAIAAVPARTIGRAYYIHTTGSTDGVGHAQLADGIIHPFLALVSISSQSVAPHAHLSDSESCFVGSLLICHDGFCVLITGDGEIHTLQPESLVLRSPLLR